MRRFLSMPLLAKELTEQAARGRTYWIRVLYAGLLFLGFALFFHDVMRGRQADVFRMLGSGRSLLEGIVGLQFTGIYLFLPAMMCGVITMEKERGAMALLLLTDLRAGEILTQKFLSRMIPMFNFMLLSLPLMAIAYSYGGITSGKIWLAVLLLLLCAFQVAAIALMFSCFCRTTVQAFMGTYIFGLILVLTLPIVDELRIVGINNQTACCMMPPVFYFDKWYDGKFLWGGPV